MRTIFFVMIWGMFCLLGCEKLLEENPKAIAVETFYKTPDEVEAALNAIYSPFRAVMTTDYPAQIETYADYGYGKGSYSVLRDYQKLDETNISRISNIWTLLYRAVRNANIAIANIPAAEALNDIQVNNYLAEARFMRGYMYLYLVQCWGGVPKRTEDNMGELDVPRSSDQEIWDLILADLEFAKDNLPLRPRAWGAPSTNVAKTVLTEVYLHLERYSDARTMAHEVITSGEFALVPVAVPDDFLKLYGPGVTHTSEEIFYQKYSRSQGWWWIHYLHAPNSYSGPQGIFANYSDSENYVLKNWDRDDLRFQFNWYPRDVGFGPNTLLCKKFQDTNTPNGSGDVDIPLYRYADLLLYFAEAETRVNGVTSDALDALNQVHRRAYGYSPLTASPVDFQADDFSQQSLLDQIIEERCYETVFELKRWNDLKRLGIVKERIKLTKGVDVSDTFLLWPIPVNETNYNSAIDPRTDQNPGY